MNIHERLRPFLQTIAPGHVTSPSRNLISQISHGSCNLETRAEASCSHASKSPPRSPCYSSAFRMISLCFLPLLILLDSSLTYIISSLVFIYYPVDLLLAVWLVYLIKTPILVVISNLLPRPRWISSRLPFALTLGFAPPLYQTLRVILCFLQLSPLPFVPLPLSCLVWDLILPPSNTKETSGRDEREQTDKKNFTRLVKLSKRDWPYLSSAFVFLFLALTFEMWVPYYMGRMIDNLSNNYKEAEFLEAIIYMAVLTISSTISAGCRGGLFIFSMLRLTRRLRRLLFRAFIRQDIAFFETTKTGDISSRLSNDTSLVSRSIAANVNITYGH
ncbi:unnamed protein product [Ranitomeya imitator]|uniref:ABC transmembrane type-1 domain-containing protein n=1 Tax=Ranitomeya imitator TaxID=111125 RepID=A0ABN9LPP8_9NEOB|nr:unnamed protein product [Ranitomeya imitator]